MMMREKKCDNGRSFTSLKHSDCLTEYHIAGRHDHQASSSLEHHADRPFLAKSLSERRNPSRCRPFQDISSLVTILGGLDPSAEYLCLFLQVSSQNLTRTRRRTLLWEPCLLAKRGQASAFLYKLTLSCVRGVSSCQNQRSGQIKSSPRDAHRLERRDYQAVLVVVIEGERCSRGIQSSRAPCHHVFSCMISIFARRAGYKAFEFEDA